MWDGKKNKISKQHVCLGKELGGLNMVNVDNYITQLKVSMYKKISIDNEIKSVLYAMYPLLNNIEKYGYEYINTMMHNVKNLYWTDVLKSIKKVLICKQPTTYSEILCEHIFYNKNICINNHTIFYKSWAENDVTTIYHLTKDDGTFLSFNEFQQKYVRIQTNFLVYNGLIRSIRDYMRKNNIQHEQCDDVQEPVGWRILKGSKQNIKENLTKKPNPHSSLVKWNNNFIDLNWPKIFNKCNKTTPDTKLKWFQIRLLYRVLPTNRFLFLRKIKNSETCDLCQNDVETLEHMFFDCDIVKIFWQNITDKFIDKLPHANLLNLSKELIIFGYKRDVKTDKPLDLFILCCKYYIYSCKFKNAIPNADVCLKIFKYRYRIEKMYYENDDISTNNFEANWLPYQAIIANL